jgi:ribosomal peptide maturation radical SAM protein 1
MSVDVVLCSAPVMSVVRPSIALGLLQASLQRRGITCRSLYLNLLFAEAIGIDLNEEVAMESPASLRVGDWLFAGTLGKPLDRPEVATHRRALERSLGASMADLLAVREEAVPAFVATAAAAVLEHGPRLVGFTTMFDQTAASLAIAAEIKRRDPSIIVCMGGANCHGPMGEVLLRHYPQLDYVFTGEADLTFEAFAVAVLATGRASGIAGCLGRGEAKPVPPSPLMELERSPIPAYGDYFRQLALLAEHDRIRVSTPFESSRGCWWGQKHHCTFCGLNAEGMAFRAKSPERVLSELQTLERAHGVSLFAATDNIIALPHVAQVLAKLAPEDRSAPPPNRRLFYEMKSNADEAQLEIMARGGVVLVQPGIESLSADALRIMRKGVTPALNLRLLRNAAELGMGVIWSFLYGFPGERAETYGEIARLLPLFSHFHPPVSCTRIRLDRFSPNYERAAELGFSNVVPVPAYGAIYDVPREALAELAYFFDADAPTAAREADMASLREAIRDWRQSWYDAPTTPQLSLVEVGDGGLIKDTRSVAVEPLYYAARTEYAALRLLRSPLSREAFRDRFGQFADARAADHMLEALLTRKFVVEIAGDLLTLVAETGREIYGPDDRTDAPTGYVLPREPAPSRQLEPSA